MLNVESLVQAYEQGHNKASSLQIGDKFMGAMPEAIAAGYARDTSEYSMFVDGYMHGLRKFCDQVYVDQSGHIVKG